MNPCPNCVHLCTIENQSRWYWCPNHTNDEGESGEAIVRSAYPFWEAAVWFYGDWDCENGSYLGNALTVACNLGLVCKCEADRNIRLE